MDRRTNKSLRQSAFRWNAWLALSATACLLGQAVMAEEPLGQNLDTGAIKANPVPMVPSSEASDEIVAQAVKSINQELRRLWAAKSVEPAAVCDDNTFLRRVYLDLVGRVPSVDESRHFLNDASEGKRENLVDRLLASSEFVSNSALFWRRVWLPQTDGPGSGQLGKHFDQWFATQISEGVGYDSMVEKILSLPKRQLAREVEFSPDYVASSIFVAVSESQPATMAANTTRAFLGLNLDCAQCHDHPYASWSQDQFWQFAAFFSGSGMPAPGATPQETVIPVKLEIKVDGTDRTVQAQYLSGEAVENLDTISPSLGPTLLAKWVTSDANPYMARHAANRLWARFCGAGLVEPLDDLSRDPEEHHLAILEILEKSFRDLNFDFKQMEKIIVLTDAYQLSSHRYTLDAPEPQAFAVHPVRALTGEQLFDSISLVAGKSFSRDREELNRLAEQRRKFSTQFRIDRPESAQRSIPQALTLMNGDLIDEASSLDHSALAQSMTAPFWDHEERLDYLYLATFSRYPTNQERAQLLPQMQALTGTDLELTVSHTLWAMLNSTEFNTNH